MLVVTCYATAAGQTSQDAPCVACQALSITPGQVAQMPGNLNGLRVVVRAAPGAFTIEWAKTLTDLRARGAEAGVHLTGIPAETDPALVAGAGTIVVEATGTDPDRVAFELKRAFAVARGRDPQAALLVAAAPDVTAALRERGVAPYVSGFIDAPAALTSLDELVTATQPRLRVRVLPSSGARAIEIAMVAASLQAWFPEGLVSVPDRALRCGEDRRVPTFLNPKTLDLIGVTSSCAAPATVTSDMPGADVERYDLAAASAFLVHAGSGTRFAEGVDVSGARALSAEEIVARHQAVAARQRASITSDIASGTMTLTFEAPGFAAPITVASRVTVYEDRGARIEGRPVIEVQQADIKVNGVSFNTNGGVPKLPIIEPERVAAPPLAITLSDVYRYERAGRERIRGRDAYVIRFAPRATGQSLFDGRAWIDAQTFGMIRVSAAQTGLTGAITASEQTDDFAPDADGRWLLTRSEVQQTYEGASVRTPIHRVMVIARHDVNAADFARRLEAAHASPDVMLRDTPEGFRYLARKAPREPATGEPAQGEVPMFVRELAGRSSRIRTIAFGTIIDPNISVPLPFAGLSYVDFDLFGTGTQFSGFFGGSYAQLAFSAPSIGGTKWQIAGRAFAIASSYNDRAFEEGRELYEQDIRQRPAQAAVWLLRPLSPRTAVRFEYDWDYNRYGRGDVTALPFVVPRNQNAHAVRVAFEAQRAGWQTTVWGSYARRIGWRQWGLPGNDGFRASHRDFTRYGASIARARAISPRLTTRAEFAVMGGRDLDRFSRYAFGTFDNRLHGYPSALIRYDRGAVLRTTAAVTLGGGLRLDGFADTAAVRDPGFGPTLRQYTGVGSALEAPGPFRTLLSIEWGYGFQGINSNGSQGTHVMRVTGYKVF